jgi:hypothetical protein
MFNIVYRRSHSYFTRVISAVISGIIKSDYFNLALITGIITTYISTCIKVEHSCKATGMYIG